ncbi:hypothetical protein [Actinocrispum wychmicini]|uniref:Glycine-rich domain-containing protein n=1 Tax=Actinocrispum wychmicini TaxID=1213861 RepID=A0A4R2JHS9_9PSEU|nr:hypothetical protein [Actinocrispum wychmicini]TCO59431.1 hypothetical protein EV192_104273 [Actinocrispum wychmicini]
MSSPRKYHSPGSIGRTSTVPGGISTQRRTIFAALTALLVLAGGIWVSSADNASADPSVRTAAAPGLNAQKTCIATCTVNVPAGAAMLVELWGAGGGGGGGYTGGITGSGGGGGYVRTVINNVGGTTGTVQVTANIGDGGRGGGPNELGSKGGDTTITVNGMTVAAFGGEGGSLNGGAGGFSQQAPYVVNATTGDTGGGYKLSGTAGDKSFHPGVAVNTGLTNGAGTGGVSAASSSGSGAWGNAGMAIMLW